MILVSWNGSGLLSATAVTSLVGFFLLNFLNLLLMKSFSTLNILLDLLNSHNLLCYYIEKHGRNISPEYTRVGFSSFELCVYIYILQENRNVVRQVYQSSM